MCNGSQAGQGYGFRQMAPSMNYGDQGMPSTGPVNYGPTLPYGEAALPPTGDPRYGAPPVMGEGLGMDSRAPATNVRYGPTSPFGESALPPAGPVRYGPTGPAEGTPQQLGAPPQLDANGQPISPEALLRWQQFRSMPRGF